MKYGNYVVFIVQHQTFPGCHLAWQVTRFKCELLNVSRTGWGSKIRSASRWFVGGKRQLLDLLPRTTKEYPQGRMPFQDCILRTEGLQSIGPH